MGVSFSRLALRCLCGVYKGIHTASWAELEGLDLLEFTKTWRAGYMRRTKAIAAGEPGPTNVDVLHREACCATLQLLWKF